MEPCNEVPVNKPSRVDRKVCAYSTHSQTRAEVSEDDLPPQDDPPGKRKTREQMSSQLLQILQKPDRDDDDDGSLLDEIQQLLAVGADPNAVDSLSRSCACLCSFVKKYCETCGIAELSVSAGELADCINQELKTKSRCTALLHLVMASPNKYRDSSGDSHSAEPKTIEMNWEGRTGAHAGATSHDGATEPETQLMPSATSGNEGSNDLIKEFEAAEAVVNKAGGLGRSCLHFAASRGKIEICRALLSAGASPYSSDRHGITPLMEAAWSDKADPDLVQYLIVLGADVNKTDIHGRTSLHFAARRGKIEIVRALLLAGASAEATDRYGVTPLMEAAVSSETDPDSIIELISAGADVNKTDQKGWSSLHWASCHGRSEFVGALISAGAAIDLADHFGNTPLLLVHKIRNAQREGMAQQLIAAGADVNVTNERGETALQHASRGGDEKIVDLLLSRRASLTPVDKHGMNALFHATASKNVKLVRKLIDAGSDINYNSNRFVGTGFYCGPRMSSPTVLRVKLVRKLIGAGLDISYTCNPIVRKGSPTVLHTAVVNGDVDMVKFLLAQGADPNLTREISLSVLILASEERVDKKLTMLKLLLSHGADMYASCRGSSESFFEHVVRSGKLTALRLLLEQGLDLGRCNPQTPNDFSPLHEAIKCEGHSAEILSLLLEHNAAGLLNLEHEDGYGRSPLIAAITARSLVCVKLLLQSGVDVEYADHQGYTPMKIAFTGLLSNKPDVCKQIVQSLVKAGAKLRNVLAELIVRLSHTNRSYDLDGTAKCIVRWGVLYESQNLTIVDSVEHEIMGRSCMLLASYEKSVAEIASLRSSLICGSISYYDVLVADESFHRRVRDEQVYGRFDEKNARCQFPVYAEDLCNSFNEVKDNHKIWEKAVKKLGQYLFSLILTANNSDPDAYYFVILNILRRLDDRDLHSLSKA